MNDHATAPTSSREQAAPVTDLVSEQWIVRNGAGIQVMETLSVGAILTALALELGASNLMIGALAAVPHLSQLAQIPAVFSVDRAQSRKRVYQLSGWVARPMILVIAAAAIGLSGNLALGVILVAFSLRYTAGAYLACSWNSWMRDLVPDRDMGRLFGRRQKRMIGIGIILSLVAAAFIDAWKAWVPMPVVQAYGLVYCVAFLGGAYSVYCARHIFEPQREARKHEPLLGKLRAPFRDKNYRRLIRFLASWNFAVNLAAPFFTVHMLKRMELELTWVIGFGALSQLAAYFAVSRWGQIADRFSNKSVLRVCGPLFVLCIFAWTFTTMPNVHQGTIPLLIAIHIATGVATAGVTLASGNIALKLAPQGDATAYLASSALVNALAAGGAALFGGAFADLFATWELSLILNWHDADTQLTVDALNFSYWDFYFFMASILGLYALHRLSLVTEDGEVRENVAMGEFLASLRQSSRNLSTVAGLRAASSFPVDAVGGDSEQVGPSESGATTTSSTKRS